MASMALLVTVRSTWVTLLALMDFPGTLFARMDLRVTASTGIISPATTSRTITLPITV